MSGKSLNRKFDKIGRSRLKISLIVISGLAFLILISYFNFRNPTPEQTDNLINRSAPLKNVDNLCENLPKPEDFHFVGKIVSGNSYTFAISHYYQSELEYNKVETFYLQWFTQNNWLLETHGTLDFRKGNLIIHINRGSWAGANYAIYCAEES